MLKTCMGALGLLRGGAAVLEERSGLVTGQTRLLSYWPVAEISHLDSKPVELSAIPLPAAWQ